MQRLTVVGAFLIMVGGIFLLLGGKAQTGFDALTIGLSFLALVYASVSGAQMTTLTNLNFYEKMSMMVKYYDRISKIDVEKSKRGSYDLGQIVDECNYDLLALSSITDWASSKNRKKLIDDYVIKIIETSLEKDSCNNNRGKICGLVKTSLEITLWFDFRTFRSASSYRKLKNIHEQMCG
jgi:ribosomal protein L30E